MTYTGSLALRLAGAEELLARSATFQARCGKDSGDFSGAKTHIHAGELTLLDVVEMVEGGTLALARPCAILGVQMHSYTQISQGGGNTLGANGAVWVILTDNAKSPDNHKLSLLDFCDFASGVMDDIAQLFGQDYAESTGSTLWPFSSIAMFMEPLRPDIADRQADDYWICGYMLRDAINGGGG
jgi:hypothetical protein